jgi:hypothetical protein
MPVFIVGILLVLGVLSARSGAVASGVSIQESRLKDVTIDQILRACTAAGGRIAIIELLGTSN